MKTKMILLLGLAGAFSVMIIVFASGRQKGYEPVYPAVQVLTSLTQEDLIWFDENIWEDDESVQNTVTAIAATAVTDESSLTASETKIVTEHTVTNSEINTCETVATVSTVPKKSNLIDLNNASIDELMELNGVGPVIAGKIYDYAKEKGFKSVEDLINVKGIGEKKLEQIKPYVYVK